jgi:hypothetical protein
LITEDKLKSYVNSSGFPLQIGIEHMVRSIDLEQGWKVVYKEYPWKNMDNQNSGFIDLVLADRSETTFMVIECKRLRDTSWIFLLPAIKQGNRKPAHVWVSRLDNKKPKFFDWFDVTGEPPSAESEFCVVPGQDNKNRPMLERISSELIESTEALAREERLLNTKIDFIRFYANVIVTTAELHLCIFKPEEISVRTGMIANPQFTSVPFLRFRKSLSSKSLNELNLEERNRSNLIKARKNTIFIVNSNTFQEFLRSFSVDEGCFEYFK